MTRGRRLAAITAAWAVPVAWISVALFAGPSDGTTVAPPAGLLAAGSWSAGVPVVHHYGGTPLREGDVVESVGGRTVAEWLSADQSPSWGVGDSVPYKLLRRGEGINLDITVEVELQRFPFLAAAGRNIPTDVLVLVTLLAASVSFWQRPADQVSRATLVAAATLPAASTSYPFGPDVVDLVMDRGPWVLLAGEFLAVIGVCAMLVAAVSFPRPPAWLRRHPLAYLMAGAPLLGWGLAALAAFLTGSSDTARLRAVLGLGVPAALATALPAGFAALLLRYRRARIREDRVALRLVLLAWAGALGAGLFLNWLPDVLTGRPLVPGGLLVVLLAPTLLACLLAAVLRYRLEDVEATVRRSLLQAVVAAAVGSLFLAAVGPLNLTSEASVQPMLAGGAVALLLVPLAFALWRGLRLIVYGDREFPYRVVSELRRLDPLTSPDDVLQEMLVLLARRLRLSFAEIEAVGPGGAHLHTSIGTSRGRKTTVDLAVAGSRLGRLRIEVAPTRDPFGPGDRRLLEDVGGQVGALVQAVLINQELQRSREHLVTAREEERLRIRRDLHDGLGPSLATLALRLEAARDLIADDPRGAIVLVGELSEQARAEIREIRRLVDGLRPPTLDQLGLVAALRQSAEEHNVASTASHEAQRLIWRVEADDALEPLPAAVEVAAYRIAAEAVNNAQRHSGASTCVVTLHREGDALYVEVRDDGTGVDPGSVTGIGLSSMRERAEELGGTWSVESTQGGGTTVVAVLPVNPIPAQGVRS
jgi:two-component system NarL family sensor kinase